MTLSTQTSGREWASPRLRDELTELSALGVNWIAIHPYAWIRADGTVRHSLDPARPPAWLRRPIEEAHARGLSILIKPHLGYWGSPFRWRGEIAFHEPTERRRFWASYSDWIRKLAEIASDAEGFCIGTELDGMLEDPSAWRRLIADVRARTPARLTYAANWDAYGRVPFWDGLDAIGVQAYFPLAEQLDPSPEALFSGWDAVLEGLRGLSLRTGKPVVFTELGYDRSEEAARRPWAEGGPRAGTAAVHLQLRCLDVALAVLDRESDWLRGAFLWKWFVGDPGHDDTAFFLDRPEVRAVLERHWGP